jgi:hypothetical protein
MSAEVFMNTGDTTSERVQPRERSVMIRALYIVPHIVEDRRFSIAQTAYFKAARRGFAPGRELEDWLAAENEVDQRLAGEGRVF